MDSGDTITEVTGSGASPSMLAESLHALPSKLPQREEKRCWRLLPIGRRKLETASSSAMEPWFRPVVADRPKQTPSRLTGTDGPLKDADTCVCVVSGEADVCLNARATREGIRKSTGVVDGGTSQRRRLGVHHGKVLIPLVGYQAACFNSQILFRSAIEHFSEAKISKLESPLPASGRVSFPGRGLRL